MITKCGENAKGKDTHKKNWPLGVQNIIKAMDATAFTKFTLNGEILCFVHKIT
jgi:hypothetical protein